MRSWTWLAVLAAMGCVASGACSSSNSESGSPSNWSGTGGGSNTPANGPSVGNASATSGGGSAATLPPEMKVESDYQSPVATGQFVWTANPTSGRVAYIDAKSFAVQTAPAGDGPTYLAAVPDPSGTSETAIVINVRSHDSTLLRHDSATGVTTTAQYPSTADANSWAISPKGRWAIAWTDATKVMNPDPTQGFQEMKVLRGGRDVHFCIFQRRYIGVFTVHGNFESAPWTGALFIQQACTFKLYFGQLFVLFS